MSRVENDNNDNDNNNNNTLRFVAKREFVISSPPKKEFFPNSFYRSYSKRNSQKALYVRFIFFFFPTTL